MNCRNSIASNIRACFFEPKEEQLSISILKAVILGIIQERNPSIENVYYRDFNVSEKKIEFSVICDSMCDAYDLTMFYVFKQLAKDLNKKDFFKGFKAKAFLSGSSYYRIANVKIKRV